MYRVLIVDDEPWALRGYENILNWREYGYEICCLSMSSTTALEKIREMKPDVVVTDIRMPGMNGLQLIHTCRQEGCTAEFVVISGFDDFYYVQEAMNLGAFYYMLKPVSSEELGAVLNRLREHLDIKRSSRDLRIRGLLRDIYVSENTTATFLDLFSGVEDGNGLFGAVVLQEAELNQLSLRVFRKEVSSISLRVTTNLTAYFILSPWDPLVSLDPEIFRSASEMGVVFYASGAVRPDVPVNEAVRSAEKALNDGERIAVASEETSKEVLIGEIRTQNSDIQRIVDYIQVHYTENLSLERISTEFHFSFSYICHMFKRETGVTFLEYLTEIRMNKACELLRTTDLEVKKIAASVGYSDYYYFCRIFKKKYGHRPSGLRKEGEPV